MGGAAVSYNQTLRRTFTYDALGQQTAAVDWYTANGTQQSTTNSVLYNRFGEVTDKLLNGNLLTRYNYDQAGRVIEQRDSQGITQFAYDLAGKVNRTTQLGDTSTAADDRITYTRYNLIGHAQEQHLPAFEANINADTLNNVTLTLTTPIIRQTTDRWGNMLSRTDARGYLTTYTYDHSNKILSETLPVTDILRENGTSYRASLIHEKRYDAVGNLIQEVDLVGPYTGVATSTELRTRQHVYNAAGELTRDIDALGYSRTYRVDIHGNRVATQDALGTVLVESYDVMDRHIAHGIIRNGAAVTLLTNQYDQAGRLYGEISGTTAVEETLVSIANANWTSTTTGEMGNTKYTLFDERGNIVKTRNESKVEKAFEYDVHNRKVKETDGLNNTLTWTYNAADFGRLSARKDLGNRVYSYTYNGFGQLTRESLALPPVADSTVWTAGPDKTYSYYSNGLSKATIEGTLTTSEVGVVTAEDSRTSSYEYDLAGNRVREINSSRYLAGAVNQASSNETRSRFDEQGRLKGVKAPAGNQLIGMLGTQYTLALTARIDSLTYDYDELGNRRRIYLDTTNQAGGRHTIDDWNTYDLEGRALIAEGFRNKSGRIVAGALAHKNVSRLAKGYIMSYNAIGQRLSSESWQKAVYTKVTIGRKGDPRTTVNKYTNDSYLRTGYAYNDMGQVTAITAKQFYRAPLADTSASSQSAGSHETIYTAAYDHQGVRLSHTEATFDWNGASNQRKSRTSTLFTYRGDLQISSQLLYNDGKLVQGNYFNEADMINAAGQQESYRYVVYKYSSSSIDHLGTFSTTFKLFDSYREDVATVVRTNKGSPGTTTNTYTERGELLHTVGIGGNVFNRKLASNREGQLITRQEASGLTQNYAYHQGTAVANAGNASVPEISDTSTPISALYPARTPGNYVVTQGDTLESIAQALWGDSRMWYLIADANGLAPSAVLTPGDNLKIPNVVSSNHNDATTFKPYNPDDVIGDTTPRTINPAPPPPPKPKKKKCGGIAAVVMVVVAVVVTIYTAGAASAAIGAATATTATTAGAVAGAAGGYGALGVAVLAGGAGTALGAGAIIGGAMIGAAAGSAASQLAGKAMGVVDKFSWSQVAVSGLSAGIGSGLGSLAKAGQFGTTIQGMNSYAGYSAQGVFNYAASQAANRIVGLDTSFSWSGLASSVVSANVGGYLNGQFGDKLPGKILEGQIGAHASAAMNDKWLGGSRPNYGQVAADAFGNSLGNYVVKEMGKAAEQEKLARWTDGEIARAGAMVAAQKDDILQGMRDTLDGWSPELNPSLAGGYSGRAYPEIAEVQARNVANRPAIQPAIAAAAVAEHAQYVALDPNDVMCLPQYENDIIAPINGSYNSGAVKRLTQMAIGDALFPTSLTLAEERGLGSTIRSWLGTNDTFQNATDIAAYRNHPVLGSGITYGQLTDGVEWATLGLGLLTGGVGLSKLFSKAPNKGLLVQSGDGIALDMFGKNISPRTQSILDKFGSARRVLVEDASGKQSVVHIVDTLGRREVKVSDLGRLQAAIGNEFSLVRGPGGQRVLLQGDPTQMMIPEQYVGNGWKWSGHSHPYGVEPSSSDRLVLRAFQQEQSIIKSAADGRQKTFTQFEDWSNWLPGM
ncbi:LysM peptidoglycan-binding domain-containing protein [Pseudomonas anguilliseptica]|uniref:LysM peptidoglycan-binding domain-containing protein n=1 Tax=Pseudomonas anguilliseptica TaxID=53406 RepID=UPI0022AE6D87|nr:LysM peptidoglycan-binding domain-containing protein [Pseudomonas anguilliseptica]MCZ4324630.1 LysM peptidoglycan-binding domain-containing protein [Pseudomonas anguilliseptica]